MSSKSLAFLQILYAIPDWLHNTPGHRSGVSTPPPPGQLWFLEGDVRFSIACTLTFRLIMMLYWPPIWYIGIFYSSLEGWYRFHTGVSNTQPIEGTALSMHSGRDWTQGIVWSSVFKLYATHYTVLSFFKKKHLCVCFIRPYHIHRFIMPRTHQMHLHIAIYKEEPMCEGQPPVRPHLKGAHREHLPFLMYKKWVIFLKGSFKWDGCGDISMFPDNVSRIYGSGSEQQQWRGLWPSAYSD